jgi:DNA-binding response OmpR family regulator
MMWTSLCEALNDIDASHACLTAVKGQDALHQLRNTLKAPPDCLFLDVNMPQMDGKTCLKELKKDAELKSIPVVIYTTSSHLGGKVEMLRLGASHFLTKAYNFHRLRTNIEEALRRVLSEVNPKEVGG